MTHNYIPPPERLTAKPIRHLFARALAFFAVALLAIIWPCKLLAQAPTISTFNPAIGAVGALVTVNGVNLNAPTTFTIGGQNAIVVSNTGSILVAMVMPGAATGPVSITTAGGMASSNTNFAVTSTPFPSVQQGTKLVATSSTSVADQGWSVALSADGNTAIVGGISDNSGAGAAWVYTRSAGAWAQQAKLFGTGAVGAASQGRSVSLSADGNTALVGGPTDNSDIGAVWVYTRNGGVWTQQGTKLLASDYSGHPELGFSVSLSADGNSAVIGGDVDNSGIGAAWIYTRSDGTWAQQGLKLVGSLSVGNAVQGFSVSMSADGNTAIAGGPGDNKDAGAAWVYTKTGGVWTQQGSKLVGTGAVGAAFQGQSVSLSADGNAAMVGGGQDNNAAGAAWVYSRAAGAWTQQGSKLTDNDGMGAGVAGWSVFLSADGKTAIVGGYEDNSYMGAAWVYTNNGGVWTQRGLKLAGAGVTGTESFQGYAVALSADGSTAMVGGPYDNSQQGAAWVYTVASSNANLSALALSAGTLSPAFASGTKSYTVSVTNATLSLTVTPATANINATVTVNNITVTSGTSSPPISLNEGATTKIIVEVTAQNGNKQSYLIAVTRAASTNDDLSAISLTNPSAALTTVTGPDYKDYTASVSNAIASIEEITTTSDPNATINVNGTAVTSGVATAPIALNVGTNTITTVVTAQNGVSTKTYVITVTRAPSINANLASMNPSAGPLTPVFSPKTTSYILSVSNAIATMTVKPITSEANATIQVNGTALASGTVSQPIALAEGTSTPINVVVTAQDGATVKTYTITVTRAASTVATLSGLTLSSGTLSPVFAAATMTYSASVPNTTSTLTLTPNATDANAAITVNGTTVPTGTSSGAIALNVGANTITTVVTAQSGTATKTYTVTVTRAASINASLASMSPSVTPLSPTFAPATLSYTLAVKNTVSSMTVKPVTSDPTATLKVNGTSQASGTVSAPIALAVGSNTITVLVTAQDGKTTKTYTIIATRASGGADAFVPIAIGTGISVSKPTETAVLAEDGIVIHAGISPNGDGINDFLTIENISKYPDNKLAIMNRNGQLIYEAKGYDNSSKTFDGHSNKNGQMQLPGTYFYQLDYTVGGIIKHKTGFIVLKY